MTLIGRFGTTYTIKRPGVGSRVDGRWVAAATGDVSIVASVQPMNHHEALLLPEGWRDRGAIKIYTATELRAANPDAKTKGDQIVYQGFNWEVQTVDPWDEAKDIPHFKCIALKVEKDT